MTYYSLVVLLLLSVIISNNVLDNIYSTGLYNKNDNSGNNFSCYQLFVIVVFSSIILLLILYLKVFRSGCYIQLYTGHDLHESCYNYTTRK